VKLLALETATRALSCALAEDGRPLASFSLVAGQRHAEVLMPAVDHICRVAGVAVQEIEAVAVDNGPGLFTGLRVGLAAGYAIASARKLPVVGVSSLEALAHPQRRRAGLVAPVVDARRGEVFWSLYRSDGSHLEQLEAPSVASPDVLAGKLAALAKGSESPANGPTPSATGPVTSADRQLPPAADAPTEPLVVLAVGDGAWRYRDLLGDAGAEVAGPGEMWPAATVVAELGWRSLSSQKQLEGLPAPVYLRQADVRIGWEEVAGRVGPVPPGSGGAGARTGSASSGARLDM
jgi:tRNA threonylcarbamoyladenosine biosynthesis protein TsaB